MTDDEILRALGNELRLAREAQGLNRTELVQRMDTNLSSQALANYEYGIRHCTVVKLVQICHALDTPAMDLLALALQRSQVEPYPNTLQIDLQAVLDNDSRALATLRTWARHRTASGTTVAVLSREAAAELACLVGMTLEEFVTRLVPFMPSVAPRWTRA